MSPIHLLQVPGLGAAGEASRAGRPHCGRHGAPDVAGPVLSKVNAQQIGADQAVRDLATWQTDNLHGVLLSVAKADLSFRLFLETCCSACDWAPPCRARSPQSGKTTRRPGKWCRQPCG